MEIIWTCKKFESLTLYELYDLLRLRTEIFVVEQHCVFQDMDHKDQDCFHVMGHYHNQLVAYSRLVPPGLIYEEASIGRVITAKGIRRSGVGKSLMKQSLKFIAQLYGEQPVQLGAQFYLEKFYESFGFKQTGEMYLEDGIEHIHMIRSVTH